MVPSSVPITQVTASASAPPITSRSGRADLAASAEVRRDRAGDRQRDQHGDERHRNPPLRRRQQDRQQRQQRAEREGDRGRQRRLPGADQIVLIDVQLDLEVRRQGIVRGQLDRDLTGGRVGETRDHGTARSAPRAPPPASRAALASPSRSARVRCRAGCSPRRTRRAPSRSHRRRGRRRPAVSRAARVGGRSGDADDEGRDRDDAVVGARARRRAAS